MTAAEQVTGYQRRLQFNVQMRASDVDRFLDELRDSLGAADIGYWVLPVSRSGTFGEDDGANRSAE